MTKPAIFTESDRILNDLRDELSVINQRVSQLEMEQEANRELIPELAFQRSLSHELMESHAEETEANRDNLEALAGIMHQLKVPVSDVVDNLNEIVNEIEDKETEESLRECIETAFQVLESYNEVEAFCETASRTGKGESRLVKLKEFFKNGISSLQNHASFAKKHKFRLLIGKGLPTQCLFDPDMVSKKIQDIALELEKWIPEQSVLAVSIASKSTGEKYGVETQDLLIRVECSQPSDLKWKAGWANSIKANQEKLGTGGLRLLQSKEEIRKSGGKLEFINKEDKVCGYEIALPLVL